MAFITGGYLGSKYSNPVGIAIRGSVDEIQRIRDVAPQQLPDTFYAGPDPEDPKWTFYGPADKQLVREIAKRVELDCNDQPFIDWMRQP